MSVSIKPVSTPMGLKLQCKSVYHPDFAPAARKLGGSWLASERAWYFDPRDEPRVRALCRSIYGTDGSPTTNADLVTFRLTALRDLSGDRSSIYYAGRCLATAHGRDSGARLGGGVVLLSGHIGSGGSVKNWVTKIDAGAILEVRDVPRAAFEQEGGEGEHRWCRIALVSDAQPDAANSLEAERAQLSNRIAEIDAEIARRKDPPSRLFESENRDAVPA